MNNRRDQTQYVVCVSNLGYRASLVVRRIYRVIPDNGAVKRGLIRVIDESGEDYLYPKRHFVAVDLPRTVTRRFARAS